MSWKKLVGNVVHQISPDTLPKDLILPPADVEIRRILTKKVFSSWYHWDNQSEWRARGKKSGSSSGQVLQEPHCFRGAWLWGGLPSNALHLLIAPWAWCLARQREMANSYLIRLVIWRKIIYFFFWKRCARDLSVLVIMVNTYQVLVTFQVLFLALCKYKLI